MRFAQACLGDRLLTIGRANPRERPMRGPHVARGLMPWERSLLGTCVNGVREDFYFFDRTFELYFAETKSNELEQRHQIQRRRSGFDVLLVKRSALQMKRKIE